MVQAEENWAILEGTVQAIRPSDAAGGDFVDVDLAVERVEDDRGFPNLLREAENAVVALRMPREVARELSLSAGTRVRSRASKASPFVVVAARDGVTLVSR